MSAFVTHPIPISDDSPFPLANIPFGIISTTQDPSPRAATPVGNYVLDLRALANDGHLETATPESLKDAWNKPVLNAFASLPRKVRSKVREDIQSLIKSPESVLYNKKRQHMYLHPLSEVKIHLPMKVEGFSDFMCSLEHVTNGGRIRGFSQVPANFFNLPLGYNGRASSVVVDGTSIKRPSGIIDSEDGRVDYKPCEKLDYEMEMGLFVSQPLDFGEILPASRAHEHIFGFVVLNDWSARDVQFYEATPLGPFNGKAFGTSISPWVVTLDALEEVGAIVPAEETTGLDSKHQAFSIPHLSCASKVAVQTMTFLTSKPFSIFWVDSHTDYARLVSGNDQKEEKISQSCLSHLHWSPFQMLAHQASAGCGLQVGDLIGTGTLSSSKEQAEKTFGVSERSMRLGCLLEQCEDGKAPMKVAEHTVQWLEDGDEITMEGWAGEGSNRIGFGRVSGVIATASM